MLMGDRSVVCTLSVRCCAAIYGNVRRCPRFAPPHIVWPSICRKRRRLPVRVRANFPKPTLTQADCCIAYRHEIMPNGDFAGESANASLPFHCFAGGVMKKFVLVWLIAAGVLLTAAVGATGGAG